MQLITAIVRPHKVADVLNAVQTFGFHGMTVSEVSGFGKQRGHTEIYRGSEYSNEFQPKVKIEMVVDDDEVYELLSLIRSAAATGRIGDGKIWVSPLNELMRVRTAERGVDAI
jgi:nitrogen regulatory protein P-II 1